FPVARTYVAPASTLVLTFDTDAQFGIDDSTYSAEVTRYGAWFGLGHRLALEAAMHVTAVGVTAPLLITQEGLALRWAWAEWGRLFGNPALAFSYQGNNAAPPTGAFQLTLGDTW